MKKQISLKRVVFLTVLAIISIYFCITIVLAKFRMINLCKLDDYRILFSVVSPIVTSIIGVIGLILGYFYYKDKTNNDEVQRQNVRIKNNISELYDYYRLIDDNIQILFFKNIKNIEELKKVRNKINSVFDDINLHLETIEKDDKVINFTRNELDELIKIYSYIEKNDMLMHSSFSKLRKANISEIIQNYNIRLRNIKKILLKRLA